MEPFALCPLRPFAFWGNLPFWAICPLEHFVFCGNLPFSVLSSLLFRTFYPSSHFVLQKTFPFGALCFSGYFALNGTLPFMASSAAVGAWSQASLRTALGHITALWIFSCAVIIMLFVPKMTSIGNTCSNLELHTNLVGKSRRLWLCLFSLSREMFLLQFLNVHNPQAVSIISQKKAIMIMSEKTPPNMYGRVL